MTNSPPRTDATKSPALPGESFGDNAPEDIAGPSEPVVPPGIGDLPTFVSTLRAEMERLSREISTLRKELSTLRPNEITETHVPEAHNQLKSAIGDAEEATMNILDSTEAIERLTKQMDPEVAAKVTEAVTGIYEACSFQDITGQRIGKVVAVLSKIDDTVQALLAAFAELIERRPREERNMPEEPGGDSPGEHLLNGPQSAEAAINQDDVDVLMAGFE